MQRSWLVAIVFVLGCTVAVKGAVVYVNAAAQPPGDGATWTTAFTNLQDGLALASAGDEIWVARGVYKPHAFDTSVSFELKALVRILGGFAGGETHSFYRPYVTETILTGDLDDDDVTPCTSDSACGFKCVDGFCVEGANSSHVVLAESSADLSAVLDGFTVTRGAALGDCAGDNCDPEQGGGGLVFFGGRATIRNCIIRGNYADNGGGGIYSYGPFSAHIVDTIIRNNRAGHGGGVGAKVTINPVLVNVQILENVADGGEGGGIHFEATVPGAPTVVNTVIARNVVKLGVFGGAEGGGAFLRGSGLNVSFSNVTIGYNLAETTGGRGGGIHVFPEGNPARAALSNSIVWANTAAQGRQVYAGFDDQPLVTVEYSNVQRLPASADVVGDVEFMGAGNLGTSPTHDPDFVNVGGPAYSYDLQSTSPCIDAGSRDSVGADLAERGAFLGAAVAATVVAQAERYVGTVVVPNQVRRSAKGKGVTVRLRDRETQLVGVGRKWLKVESPAEFVVPTTTPE